MNYLQEDVVAVKHRVQVCLDPDVVRDGRRVAEEGGEVHITEAHPAVLLLVALLLSTLHYYSCAVVLLCCTPLLSTMHYYNSATSCRSSSNY